MITERLLKLQDVPDSIQRSIIQDLKNISLSLPSHVMLGVENRVVRRYRPVYNAERAQQIIADCSPEALIGFGFGVMG